MPSGRKRRAKARATRIQKPPAGRRSPATSGPGPRRGWRSPAETSSTKAWSRCRSGLVPRRIGRRAPYELSPLESGQIASAGGGAPPRGTARRLETPGLDDRLRPDRGLAGEVCRGPSRSCPASRSGAARRSSGRAALLAASRARVYGRSRRTVRPEPDAAERTTAGRRGRPRSPLGRACRHPRRTRTPPLTA